jgi:hypothetical protein
MTSEREMLIDQVLDQIKKDVDAGDFTAIHEMLLELPDETLLAYLPEEMR